MVGNVEITDDDFDLLRKVVCYYNMPDYDDDYIDPELKAELELAAKLENPNNVQPTLEKQETCLIASTAYTYETIKNICFCIRGMWRKRSFSNRLLYC